MSEMNWEKLVFMLDLQRQLVAKQAVEATRDYDKEKVLVKLIACEILESLAKCIRLSYDKSD